MRLANAVHLAITSYDQWSSNIESGKDQPVDTHIPILMATHRPWTAHLARPARRTQPRSRRDLHLTINHRLDWRKVTCGRGHKSRGRGYLFGSHAADARQGIRSLVHLDHSRGPTRIHGEDTVSTR